MPTQSPASNCAAEQQTLSIVAAYTSSGQSAVGHAIPGASAANLPNTSMLHGRGCSTLPTCQYFTNLAALPPRPHHSPLLEARVLMGEPDSTM